MNISFNEKTQVFCIETKNSAYYMGIADKKYLGHIYYGKKLNVNDDLKYKLRLDENPFVPSKNAREELTFNDSFPWEFPTGGRGDYRESCLEVLNSKNQNVCELEYSGFEILDSKPKLKTLPQTFCADCGDADCDGKFSANSENFSATSENFSATSENFAGGTASSGDKTASSSGETANFSATSGNLTATSENFAVKTASSVAKTASPTQKSKTLLIKLEDKVLNFEVQLYYSVFEDVDAIIKSVKIINHSKNVLKIKKIYSSSLTLENPEENSWDFVSLYGAWARERHIEKTPLFHGRMNICSSRGETSSQENNFFAVSSKNANYQNGEVYGFALIYSGNYFAQAQISQFESVRIVSGINSENFLWNLKSLEEFESPEVALVYSDEGFGKMSRTYHDLWRNHLIRGKYAKQMRPILINNWEATYFNFDTEKLLSIAKEAAACGIEMLVMDDGWFGERNDDSSSLGDWTVNEKKLSGGLKYLVSEVNKLGLKFGIWFEPEMVSKKSKIFSEHPDWILRVDGREPVLARAQYVFDITNPEVFDYVYSCVYKILKSANIEYVKWDMNRTLTDVGSSVFYGECSGEIFHRYVLAVYALQEKMLNDFPNLLFENCSAGGSRFDAGMLYYSPQIWTSDDCDAIERLAIQEGTSLCYPLSSMGSHVAACPNHTVGRTTPFLTRGFVALSGTFGYELDITKLSESEKNLIPKQIEMFKKINPIVMFGDYFRIESANKNHQFDTWECVSKNKNEAIVFSIQVLNRANLKSRFVKLLGLDENKKYEIQMQDSLGNSLEKFSLFGSTLMNLGLKIERLKSDFSGFLIYLKAI